ncbi:MAG: hypothetical protein WCK09_08740 [Bacteroidota bacterium]
MIDKKEFDNFFQYFDSVFIIDIIDMFAVQQPEIMGLLEQSIMEHDLVQIRFWAHKLRTPCGQFHDPVSSKHAALMEEAARGKILQLIDLVIPDYPDSLKKMRAELADNLIQDKIIPAKSIRSFLAGFFDTFPEENSAKLEELEKKIIADGIPEMYLDLKASSAALVDELLVMKKTLLSK